jgi:hypothetical protein
MMHRYRFLLAWAATVRRKSFGVVAGNVLDECVIDFTDFTAFVLQVRISSEDRRVPSCDDFYMTCWRIRRNT